VNLVVLLRRVASASPAAFCVLVGVCLMGIALMVELVTARSYSLEAHWGPERSIHLAPATRPVSSTP
jgi:hypothetical protein